MSELSPSAHPFKTPIPHAGGKLRIVPAGGNWYQLGFSHNSSNHGMALYQLAISHEGVPLAFVPPTGMGGRHRPYPQPSFLAMVISDAQQMWGRVCLQCRSYFRTNHVAGMTVCPYCTFAEDAIYLLTDSQRLYLRKFAETVQQAVKEQREFEIDLDEATDAPEWTYEELQLQHRFLCKACDILTDIRGEYGSCPRCGKRNSGGVFHPKLNQIELELQTASDELRSNLLNRTVSVLEAMANDLKRILVSIPCHPTRRNQVALVNFQNIGSAVTELDTWYGFDLCSGFSPGDLEFVDLMFKRRHLFTHTGGQVDEKYLKETGDRTFELHEVVVLSQPDMARFVPLVRRLGSNLISDVEKIEVR